MEKKTSMKKTKLKSFSLKDIYALKKRKKKLKLKQYNKEKNENSPKGQVNPHKFIDPFQFHHIVSDMIIIDNMERVSDKYFSGIGVLINLKHIKSIDFFDEFAYMKLENSNHYPLSPEDLVISRLRSLGNEKAMKLSTAIAEHKDLCLLIKNTKQYGFRKEFLNSFSLQNLKFLQEYFKVLMIKSISFEEMKVRLNEVLDANKRNPVFFLMYDEYKDYVGTQIIGIGMNRTMRNLIGWESFEISERKIWCVQTQDYYEYIAGKLQEYVYFEESIFQKLYINTKYGFVRINFDVKKWFINGNNEKKVIVYCVAKEIEMVENTVIPEVEFLYDQVDKSKNAYDTDDCERNFMWNHLINSYFTSSPKK